jgi:hypothetical protein
LTVAIAAAVILGGCAPPEQTLLEQFFGASRLRDTTALQRIATVVFEPLQQGIVRTFHVAEVTPERIEEHMAIKDAILDADVALPDGRTVRKTLVVTLKRAVSDDSRHWMVSGVRDAAPVR